MIAPRLLAVCTLASLIAVTTAAFAQSPNYTLRLVDRQATVGDTVTMPLYLDFANGEALAGWAVAVCHDTTALEITTLLSGSTVLSLDPDFDQSEVEDDLQGYTAAAIISFLGMSTLPPGDDYELYKSKYSALAEASASVYLCDLFLGSPPVQIVVTTPALTITPTMINATVEIGSLPPLVLRADEAQAAGGDSVSVAVQLDSTVAINGFSFGLAHDDPLATLTDIELGDALLQLRGGTGPQLVVTDVMPENGSGGTISCLIELEPPFEQLQPGVDQELCRFVYHAIGAYAGEAESTTALDFVGTIGAPVVPKIVTIDGEVAVPAFESGLLTVTAGEITPTTPDFRRGDINQDVTVELADGVLLLGQLFGSGEITCADASDVDDDGALGLTDAVQLLGYVFSGGAAPPDPFDVCGQDPTDDDLDCVTFSGCN